MIRGSITLDGTSGATAARSRDDMLTGFAGNDWFVGERGDTMIGGTGSDAYVVDNNADVVVELAGEGIDSVESSISYTLPSEIETLILVGAEPIDGIGNRYNTINGNEAANQLIGGAG